jgi:hypothetical protein
MPQPTPADVHIDAALTNVSVAYVQDASNFIADKVFPTIPVSKQSNKYWKYEKGAFMRDEAKRRAPGTESAGSGYKLGTDGYFCDQWAFHKDVDDNTLANSDDGIDPFRDAATFCMNSLLIRRERLFMDEFMKTGVWGTDDVGGVNFGQWDDEVSSDPAEDIKRARLKILMNTGYRPNTMVVDITTHEALCKHPLIQAKFAYSNAASITEGMLAAYFQVSKYLVSEAVFTLSDETVATPVMQFVAPKCCLLCYSVPTPSLLTPTAGYIMTWSGLTKLNNAGITTSRFRMQHLKSERVENEMSIDMKLVAADMGYFFSGTVS